MHVFYNQPTLLIGDDDSFIKDMTRSKFKDEMLKTDEISLRNLTKTVPRVPHSLQVKNKTLNHVR